MLIGTLLDMDHNTPLAISIEDHNHLEEYKIGDVVTLELYSIFVAEDDHFRHELFLP